jgi:serine/threonine protein kinase
MRGTQWSSRTHICLVICLYLSLFFSLSLLLPISLSLSLFLCRILSLALSLSCSVVVHVNGMVHNDLRPENILIDGNNIIKLGPLPRHHTHVHTHIHTHTWVCAQQSKIECLTCVSADFGQTCKEAKPFGSVHYLSPERVKFVRGDKTQRLDGFTPPPPPNLL